MRFCPKKLLLAMCLCFALSEQALAQASEKSVAEPPLSTIGDAEEETQCEQFSLGPTRFELADVSVSLDRSRCFGTCPSYEVTIFGDGRVEYIGREYVAVGGLKLGKADIDEFIALINQMYSARFHFMESWYEGGNSIKVQDGEVSVLFQSITDVANYVVTLRIGSFCKAVGARWDYPSELREIIDQIDEVSGVLKWVE